MERKSLFPPLLLDFVACLICAVIAVPVDALSTVQLADVDSTDYFVAIAVTVIGFPLTVMLLFLLDLYRIPKHWSAFQIFRRLVPVFVATGLVFGIVYLLFIELLRDHRGATAFAYLFSVLLLWLARLVQPSLYGAARRDRRVLLVGAHTFAVRAIQRYAREHPDEIEVAGIIDDFKGDLYFENLGLRNFGTQAALRQVLATEDIDTLIVLHDHSEYAARIVESLQRFPKVREVFVRAQIPLFMAQDIEILFVQEVPLLKVYSADSNPSHSLRELFDRAMALVGLLLTSPLFAIMPILIRLETPGPVFYRQQRLGIRNQPFWIFKFRSMVADAERNSGAVLAQKGDPRVTKVGRFMRATRIDEFPQLLNVLRGEMSMIGPRPERAEFQNAYQETIPWFSLRSLCKPGITGLAQVCGDYHTSTQRKLLYDVSYFANMSATLDLRILIATVITVLTKQGH